MAACCSSATTSDLSLVTDTLTFAYVEAYIRKNSKSSGKENLTKGFKYYCEDYVHSIRLFQDDDGCIVKGKCFRSQKKNESPHDIEITMLRDDIVTAICSCTVGQSGFCGHVSALLYKLAHLKQLKLPSIPADVAKTSLPQTWHQPRGDKLKGDRVDDMTIQGYDRLHPVHATKGIKSTLYNPLPAEFETDVSDLLERLKDTDILLPTVVSADQVTKVATNYGKFPKGSVLGSQQKLSPDYVLNLVDNTHFPDLPMTNIIVNNVAVALSQNQWRQIESLKVSIEECHEIEMKTRLQSADPKWHQIRRHRITASVAGDIVKRRKDGLQLAQRLQSTRHIQTAAMKHGLESEAPASNYYSQVMNENVNVYPCGIVVSPYCPWLAASPDRKVYCPFRNPAYGLLEIKSPVSGSIRELKYIESRNGELKLKRNHNYFYQVQMQLAITGLEWCDFLVWLEHEAHLETIYFDLAFWQTAKDKMDVFFYDYYFH